MKESILPNKEINQVWDFVNQFVCPIHYIPAGDNRCPPGDHHGTGWFIEKNGVPQLCTCEHVANFQKSGILGYAPFGGEFGVSVGSKFTLMPHPIDFAIADLSQTWSLKGHKGKCIPSNIISDKHLPVEGEYLYIQGFPGADSNSAFGQHNVKGLGAYLHEIGPPDEIFSEKPPFVEQMHICMAWSPANANSLTENADVLSVPGGLSGSVLWNTGFKKAQNESKEWSINDIRVAGIVWGASSKAGVITATPIEHFLKFIK